MIHLEQLQVINGLLCAMLNLLLFHPVDGFYLLKLLHEVLLSGIEFIFESLFGYFLFVFDSV